MRRFSDAPSMGRVYLSALLQRRPAFDPSTSLPDLRTELGPLTLDAASLAAYRAACAAKADVPVGYPQMLITPMHVAMLTEDEFPIRAMGLIHPRFSITQHRPLKTGESLRFETWFDRLREVHNGVEFDIETRAFVADQLVWESTAATFHRMANERRQREEYSVDLPERRPFEAPSDAGRRYAKVSGDYNPVHLHPLSSKLFGFSRPIAHGWWLVARCLAEVGHEAPKEPTTFSFEFRRPVSLGRTFELHASEDGTSFAILDAKGKLRLTGSIKPT